MRRPCRGVSNAPAERKNTMASKATLQRQRSSEKVVAAGRTHKDLISETVRERFGDEAGQASAALVTAVTDALETKTIEMVRRDDAHEEELRDDPEAREARDRACERLYEKLVETRHQLTAITGETYVARIGFNGRTPRDAVGLIRLGTTVVTKLAEEPTPEVKIPDYTMDPENWRAPLAELLADLEGKSAIVATEVREAEATMIAKHEAIEAYDNAFSSAANLVSTLLTIAGKKLLAKRVRPFSRRPGKTTETPAVNGSTQEATSEESADDTAAEDHTAETNHPHYAAGNPSPPIINA